MGVNAEIRQRHILNELEEKGKIYVTELAENLSVTEVTIRRDLTFLDKTGLLKKIYSGAVKITPEITSSVRFRKRKNPPQKKPSEN